MDSKCTGPVAMSAAGDVALPQPHFNAHVSNVSDGLSDLPNGFPAQVGPEFAWTGQSLGNEPSIIHHLTVAELAEILAAKEAFKALELDGDLVNRDNFPLPTLGPKLEQLGQDLYHGKGLFVIRGVKPDDHSVEDQTIIWLGIQAYIADQRGRQDHRGNMLVHIIADNSTETKLGHHRHSTSAISFHNEEAGDVVGWLTRSTAASGGKCIVASAYTIYNVLAAHRPDMIRTLAKSDWPVALPRFQCRPLIFYQDSKLMMNFGRTPLLGNATHPRPEHLPKINDRQREALDMVEAVAQAVQFELQTQAGDMHFINNLAILHRREGFVDGAGPREKRHLVRMRLRSSRLGWAIPESLQSEWHDAFEKDTCPAWHLEPMPGDAFPLRKYTN
ncbi:Clavaminate synthase-like protein [Xylariomycetidae sp. FL2044]|nr:Clavaminate synthase-like protein [Xylariomycetidae sp. FL2044]